MSKEQTLKKYNFYLITSEAKEISIITYAYNQEEALNDVIVYFNYKQLGKETRILKIPKIVKRKIKSDRIDYINEQYEIVKEKIQAYNNIVCEYYGKEEYFE